jgi:ferredoxin-NADP reductase
VIYLTGSRQDPAGRLDARRLRATVGASLALHEAYVCGPPDLTDDVVGAVRQAGIPRRHIHTEKFEL